MGLKHRHSFEARVDELLATEKSEFPYSIAGKLNLALVFPNLYSLGMSNLGFLTVFKLASSVSGVGVERFFPSLKAGTVCAPPFYSFETKRPLGDFDIMAFSFSYEGDFDKIPLLFGALGIPVKASERNRFHPIFIAGGAAVASNADALSDIFDVLIPGEAETTVVPLLKNFLKDGLVLESVKDLAGIWVPALTKKPNPIISMHDVNKLPAYSCVVTPENTFGGAHLIEIMRGCPRTCAFCLARVIYSPPRCVSLETIKQWLDERDCDDVGLVAPSLFDHPQITEILELFAQRKIRVRNSSVKWEKLTNQVMDILKQSDVQSITIAPETGSLRLLANMGKPMDISKFLETIDRIFTAGFRHLKLYFIAGLPTETDEDLDDTIELVGNIYDKVKLKGLSASVTFSGFISKKGTKWENETSCSAGEMKRKFRYIKKGLKKYADYLKINFESIQEFTRQAKLAKIGPELAEEYSREALKWRENHVFLKKQFIDLDF